MSLPFTYQSPRDRFCSYWLLTRSTCRFIRNKLLGRSIFRERMPQDLPQYVLQQKTVADTPVYEQEPTDVVSEIVSADLLR